MSVYPDYEMTRRHVAGSRRDDPFPQAPDRALEEVSRKATELEHRTRALEAENTKLRREHTKALLAAAQAQDALKEFHATASDVPCDGGKPAAPVDAPVDAPVPNIGAAAHDRRLQAGEAAPTGDVPRNNSHHDAMPHMTQRSRDTGERAAFGSLTIAACLLAMTVNYAILLRHFLGAWLAGFAWPFF